MRSTRGIAKVIGLLAMTSCATGEQPAVIAVSDDNLFGITSIETSREVGAASSTFLLRAYADGNEVASLRLTSGTIGGLSSLLPPVGGVASDDGSEIVIAVPDITPERIVTRATTALPLSAISDGARSFLRLSAVRDVLAHDTPIRVDAQAPRDAAPAPETQYALPVACFANHLLTSPTAKQCCYDNWYYPGDPAGDGEPSTGIGYRTWFVRPTDNLIIRRDQGWACKGLNGETCSGADCYYGPNGFGIPMVYTKQTTGCCYKTDPTTGKVGMRCDADCQWSLWTEYVDGTYDTTGTNLNNHCTAAMYPPWNAPIPPEFADIVGSQPRGQGCPSGSAAVFGLWDY